MRNMMLDSSKLDRDRRMYETFGARGRTAQGQSFRQESQLDQSANHDPRRFQDPSDPRFARAPISHGGYTPGATSMGAT